MASNKNFMNFISNEVAKKNLSDNPMVKFALKDFEAKKKIVDYPEWDYETNVIEQYNNAKGGNK